MKNSDLSLFPSSAEVKLVKSMDSSITVEQIPLYLFDQPVRQAYNIDSAKDLLFVGGFKHPPNRDAVLWFANEIWPNLKEAIPEAHFHVVGSNPPSEIQNLNLDRIIVHGYLSDEELNTLYAKSRMTVAPLRFGAGVKGKVVEALYRGVPVLTTPIGAEGLTNPEEYLLLADGSGEITETILENYSRVDHLLRLSEKGKIHCEKHFSKEVARSILEKHVIT